MTDVVATYNEIEPFAASWLEALIERAAITRGVVERRSIKELGPADVAGSGQRHFFAGIGVWSYALRLAGIPDDADVWTGSCPCQPFSTAGKGRGVDDERHLWPAWFRLIDECRPPIVFGEQVASPAGLAWLDAVCADLEGAHYSVGAADLCAASVGAPHIRQRLYFVAVADGERFERFRVQLRERRSRTTVPEAGRGRAIGVMADDARDGRQERRDPRGRDRSGLVDGGALGDAAIVELARSAGRGEVAREKTEGAPWLDRDHRAEYASSDSVVADTAGRSGDGGIHAGSNEAGRVRETRSRGERDASEGASRDPWRCCDWIPCTDGVSRPVEPGTFPLAHGAPARVGRLRGYGNGLVAEQAAAFIEAAIAALGDLT